MKVIMYHWNPNENYGVPLESLSNLWCTTEIPIKFNLWCTTEIPIKFMVYHWNPYQNYAVQLNS